MSQQDVKDDRANLRPEASPPEPGVGSEPFPDDHPSLRSEAQQLRDQLQQKEEEARRNYELFVRERADLENFKKRMQREKAEALRFATEPLIRELLPVVDNLERAVEHGDGESVVEGVRMVLKTLSDVLGRHGVKRIEAAGAPFDPKLHQAMAQVESAAHEPNQVVEEHQSGYLLHDRLLRPALVTVSGRKAGGAVATDSNSD